MTKKYFLPAIVLLFVGMFGISTEAEDVSATFEFVAEQDTTGNGKSIEITAYPNPCNEHLNFKFQIDETNYIKLKIFDFNGNLIKTVIDGVQYSENTEHVITYNSSHLASGAYEYMLQSGDKYKAGKFVVQR